MDVETNQEIWQVESGGDIVETNFAEMTEWIDQGSLLRIDRVRKGELRWIEAGKVPSLIEFFNAKDAAPRADPVMTMTHTEVSDVAEPTQQFINSPLNAKVQRASPDVDADAAPASDACAMHPDAPAKYVCDTCANYFCKACPNSYGGNVKICPSCGAMCSAVVPPDVAMTSHLPYRTPITEGFGFSDFGQALAYPFKFKTSLILGAIMFMLFSIGQGVAGFGGIFMMFSALACFLLANTLTFGILANTVDNFAQGKIGENFMPSFDDFSLWDDVVHPFFLMIGVYISSFGPLLAIGIFAFFMIINTATKEMNPLQSDAAHAINPELPYAANAAKQTEEIKGLLNKQQESQKTRIDAMEKGDVPQASANKPVVDASEQNVMHAQEMIQQQQKAQAEAMIGKSPETKAQEQAAMIKKVLGYGVVFLLIGGLCLLWGLFYFPAACAVAGYTRSFTAVLNPTVGLDTIKRLGGDYVKILLMGLAIALCSGLISGVIAAILSPFDLPGMGNIPARAIGSLFGFYFSVVFSCVIGLALYKASDRLKLFR